MLAAVLAAVLVAGLVTGQAGRMATSDRDMPGREHYTHGHHESVLRSHRWRTAANSAAYVLPWLKPDMEILDVGCGPGTITADLARLVPEGRVVGLDRSVEVLELARAERPSGLNLDYEEGDVYRLPFDPGSFDLVHAHQVLQHLADPVAALAEMRRVCRPGGLVAARDSDYPAMTWYPEEPGMERWREVYCGTARANGGEPAAGRRLLAWARQAGFTEVTATASVWCFATPEDRAWWGGLWADRILQSAVADAARDAGLATADELAEMSAAWRRWAERPDGWFGVLHGEVLCRR